LRASTGSGSDGSSMLWGRSPLTSLFSEVPHSEVAARGLATKTWDDMRTILAGIATAWKRIYLVTRRAADRYGLGPRGAWILMLVSEGSTSPSDIAKVMRVGPGLVTIDLNRLVKQKLLLYRKSPTDGRRIDLALTPRGTQVCWKIRHELAELADYALAGYGSDERQLFAQMLEGWGTAKAGVAYPLPAK
jgi:DNA-binding MarR family transcriptional regulator